MRKADPSKWRETSWKKWLITVLFCLQILTIQDLINKKGWYDYKVVFSDGTIGIGYGCRWPAFGIIFFFDKDGVFINVETSYAV